MKNKKSKHDRKWSYCDRRLFSPIVSGGDVNIKELLEFLSSAIIHVYDNGKDKLFTRNWQYDDHDSYYCKIVEVENVFEGKKNFLINCSIDGIKIDPIKIQDLYFNYVYDFISYDYMDWYPFLKKSQINGKKFNRMYNLFQGYKHEYRIVSKEICEEWKQNELAPIFWHVKNILCGGDIKSYEHYLRTKFHKLQNPTIKSRIAYSFYSKLEQVGKGIWGRFWNEQVVGGEITRTVNSFYSLTGKFNSRSEHTLFTIGDEISSTNKSQDVNKFKNMLTEITGDIEPKGVDPRSGKNHSDYELYTNNRITMDVDGITDKLIHVRVSEEKVGDFDYFTQLANCMEENAELFFQYAANYDLEDFKPWKNKPYTELSKETIEDNLKPELQMLLELYREDGDEEKSIDNPLISQQLDSGEQTHEVKFIDEKWVEATKTEISDADYYLSDDEDDMDSGFKSTVTVVKKKGIFELFNYVKTDKLYSVYKAYNDAFVCYNAISKKKFISRLKEEGIISTRTRIFGKQTYVFKLNYEILKKLFDMKKVER